MKAVAGTSKNDSIQIKTRDDYLSQELIKH